MPNLVYNSSNKKRKWKWNERIIAPSTKYKRMPGEHKIHMPWWLLSSKSERITNPWNLAAIF